MKIFVMMFLDKIVDDTYYTDEVKISKRVEGLNEIVGANKYWYKTLVAH